MAYRAIDGGGLECSIVQSFVGGRPSYTNVGLRTCQVPDIVEQVVGECIWVRKVSLEMSARRVLLSNIVIHLRSLGNARTQSQS